MIYYWIDTFGIAGPAIKYPIAPRIEAANEAPPDDPANGQYRRGRKTSAIGGARTDDDAFDAVHLLDLAAHFRVGGAALQPEYHRLRVTLVILRQVENARLPPQGRFRLRALDGVGKFGMFVGPDVNRLEHHADA